MNKIENDPLAWWREARFGMFIHFGIYAVAEGCWNGEPVEGLAEWMQFRKRIPVSEYSTLAKGLTLENFDAEKIASLAKAAGMKYVVFTAKHHDGFAMYDSAYSNYNVVKMCPSGRDIARELANAVRKAGLKMCFYYSQSLDWEDENAFGNDWDFSANKKNYRKFLDGKCKAQLKELLTQYGEIDLIWFDMPRDMSIDESYEVKAFVKSFQPECIVSGRINMDQSVGDYGSMGDNEFPSGKLYSDWETPATLNNTWGYRKLDTNWKTVEELLWLLIELLSKGMNYLLNIGPTATGEIPNESAQILTELGEWVHQNSDAVYGTSATPFDCDFEWGRISQKGKCLYLYLLKELPVLQMSGLYNAVVSAKLLKKDGGQLLSFSQTPATGCELPLLTVQIPKSDNRHFNVICLELDSAPKVQQGIFQNADGTLLLYAHMARLQSKENASACAQPRESSYTQEENDRTAERGNLLVGDNICIDPNGNIINWRSSDDFAQWEFSVSVPGRYKVQLQTRGVKYTPWQGGHLVELICENQTLNATLNKSLKVQNAHTRYFEEYLSDLGELTFETGGIHSVSLFLQSVNEAEKAGLLVTKLVLSPVK